MAAPAEAAVNVVHWASFLHFHLRLLSQFNALRVPFVHPGRDGSRQGCAELGLELDSVGGVEQHPGVVAVILQAGWSVGGHFAMGRMVLSRKRAMRVGNGDAGWKLKCGLCQEVGRRGSSDCCLDVVGKARVLLKWEWDPLVFFSPAWQLPV